MVAALAMTMDEGGDPVKRETTTAMESDGNGGGHMSIHPRLKRWIGDMFVDSEVSMVTLSISKYIGLIF
uniref:Uncharacterized protein n=1 Tax=Oryza nivara TaxID=4536 RepID=A0A0E0FQ41_ORYNI